MFIQKVLKLSPSKTIVPQVVAETDWPLLLISEIVKLTIPRGHNKLLLKQKKEKEKVSILGISFTLITRSLNGYWH